MIISCILQELFPVSEHEDIHGVPNLQFLSWVLLPEVVIELIKEDLDVSAMKAVKILEDSFAYGNEMFPFDDDQTTRNFGYTAHLQEHPYNEKQQRKGQPGCQCHHWQFHRNCLRHLREGLSITYEQGPG
jgi:hypothetical protein